MNDLNIKNLQTFFHTREEIVKAVDGVSFSISKGEVLGLVGESGSGKSVTCHSLLNLLPIPPAKIEGGEIFFKGNNLLQATSKNMCSLRGKSISMVFQDPMSCLNPYMSVLEQVAEPLIIHGLVPTQKDAREQAMEMLQRVGVDKIKDRENAYPHEFSGGMRQRAMIAMALITKPELLLADEPTTALDVTVQAKILKLLKSLCQELRTSILFVSHDLGVVAEIADRVVVMYRGKVVEENSTKELFTSPSHPYVKALIACRPTFETSVEKLPTVDDFMGQSPKSTPTAKVPISKSSNLNSQDSWIQVKNLAVHFVQSESRKVIKAVDGVDLSISKGKTLGLVGESGSGKTTLGRAILQLTQINSGEILWDGKDIVKINVSELLSFRKRMQIIFQDPYASLNPRLTIEQTLTEPMKVHGIGGNRSERSNLAVELLEEVGLESNHLKRYPHEFSGGQRQRICIARALAMEPNILIADEAVSALDVSVQAQVLELLEDIKKQFSLAILFITHDLRVAAQICDNIIVMKKGVVVEMGSTHEIYTQPKHPYTQSLLQAAPGQKYF